MLLAEGCSVVVLDNCDAFAHEIKTSSDRVEQESWGCLNSDLCPVHLWQVALDQAVFGMCRVA